MKTIKAVTILLLLLANTNFVAQKPAAKKETALIWYTNVSKAHDVSVASKKPIFAFFTGSDWCIWCKKIQQDVFSKTEFIKWAKKNVVLLELDYPRNKAQDPETVKQNQSLQQAFQVQGFPVIWMFFLAKDAKTNGFNITGLGSCGYPQGAEPGKEEVKFLKDANAILANKAKK